MTENLRQLSLQRQKQEQSDTTTVDDGHGRATFNLMDNDDNNSIHSGTTGVLLVAMVIILPVALQEDQFTSF